MVDSLRYYKHVVGSRTVHEVDFLNFVQVVDGIDQLEATRNALAF